MYADLSTLNVSENRPRASRRLALAVGALVFASVACDYTGYGAGNDASASTVTLVSPRVQVENLAQVGLQAGDDLYLSSVTMRAEQVVLEGSSDRVLVDGHDPLVFELDSANGIADAEVRAWNLEGEQGRTLAFLFTPGRDGYSAEIRGYLAADRFVSLDGDEGSATDAATLRVAGQSTSSHGSKGITGLSSDGDPDGSPMDGDPDGSPMDGDPDGSPMDGDDEEDEDEDGEEEIVIAENSANNEKAPAALVTPTFVHGDAAAHANGDDASRKDDSLTDVLNNLNLRATQSAERSFVPFVIHLRAAFAVSADVPNVLPDGGDVLPLEMSLDAQAIFTPEVMAQLRAMGESDEAVLNLDVPVAGVSAITTQNEVIVVSSGDERPPRNGAQ